MDRFTTGRQTAAGPARPPDSLELCFCAIVERMTLRRLIDADKTITDSIKWTEPDREDSYVRFLTRVEVDGWRESSIHLSGGAYANLPDCHVTFELAITGDGARRTRLARLDWRSITGGHTNKPWCPGVWAGRRVPATHLHCFNLNWLEGEQRMRKGKLPCAKALDVEPQSFEELRQATGLLFGISNIQIVPHPGWLYSLL